MSYRLANSPRLEDLLDVYQKEFRTDFFENRTWIVVQNQSMAQWLKLHLAERWGSYATAEILLPDMLVRNLLQIYRLPADGQKLLFMDELKTRLFFALRSIVSNPEPCFVPLARYCKNAKQEDRLFELSDHIAGLFHSYAMNGEQIVASLQSQIRLPRIPEEASSAWEWQSKLWKKVFESKPFVLAGIALEAAASNLPHPQGERPRIVLVGSAFLSRKAARFLRSWAQADLVDVVHLLLTPADDLSQLPPRSPWSNWSRFGQAFLQTLSSPETVNGPSTSIETSLLPNVQIALANGNRVEGFSRLDSSLQVVSCVNRRRELEVLKDRILAFLDQNPEVQLNDIAVLAPDMNAYAPLLDSVFSSDDTARSLPHHVIDLSLDQEHSFFQAVRTLLQLLEGRWDRALLFSFLRNPCVNEALDVTQDQIDGWLEFSQRTASLREDSLSKKTEGQSWQFAWTRLIDGFAWAEEPDGVDFDQSKYFPLDLAESAVWELEPFFAVCQTLRVLSERARRDAAFTERIHILEDAVLALVRTVDEQEAWGNLSARLYTLAQDLDESEASSSITWAGFSSFVRDQIQHFSGRRGQLLLEGIHFSSLKPLRALPFSAIAILGLNENAFPTLTPLLNFDLRPWEEGHEDLSAAALDRYTFWETLMSARKAFWLFYCGRDAVTGESRPPSSVISEFCEYLTESGIRWEIDEQPVQGFSDTALSRGTYSLRAFRQNQALSQPPKVTNRTTDLERAKGRDDAVSSTISWEELMLALRSPARSYLNRRHGIYLSEEDRREEVVRDPWEAQEMQTTAELKDLWWRSFSIEKEEVVRTLERRWKSEVGQGILVDGSFLSLQKKEAYERLENWIESGKKIGNDATVKLAGETVEYRWTGIPLSANFRYLETNDAIVLPYLTRSRPELKDSTLWEASVSAALLRRTTSLPIFAASVSSKGESELWKWSSSPEEAQKWLETVESYFECIQNEAVPFYSDYLETLGKLSSKRTPEDEAEWAETAWHDVFSTKPFFHDSRTLRFCPYARLCFEQNQDFRRFGELLREYWPKIFTVLPQLWKEGSE